MNYHASRTHLSHSLHADHTTRSRLRPISHTDAVATDQSRRWFTKLVAVIVPGICLAMLLVGTWGLQVQATPATPHPALSGDQGNRSLGDDDGEPGDQFHGEFDVEGEVLRKPSNSDGIGTWLVRSDRGIQYWTRADDTTEFRPSVPTIGQRVKVKGEWAWDTDRYWLVASRIELEERNSGGHEQKVEGILISAPSDGIGSWVIQTGLTYTLTVRVDGQTRLDDGVPTAGTWVEVRGNWQEDGTFAARRVRNDTHEVSEVVVRLTTGVVSATVATRYELQAVDTLLASGNIHLFATGEDEEKGIMARLAADPDVLWAELNFTGGIPERHGYKTWRWGGADSDSYINQNAFHQVNLAPALTAVQGEGMVIAILDTGVALDHNAFAGRLLPGYDMIDDDTVPNDDGDGLGWGHGTHIAGIVAEVSPRSMLLPVRVLDTNGRGNTFALAYAIEWAVAQGADVINLSLGAETNSQVLHNAIEYATAAGVIVVAAAGNTDSDVPQFPASYPGVLSVTAVNHENIKAEFAAFGQDWVDLAAPGIGITSTIIGPHGIGYASWSGTSMATAFVSGAAALMRQQRPHASVPAITQQFVEHTTNIDAQNPTYVGKLGGLLNVAGALEVEPTQSTTTPTPTPNTAPLPTETPTPTPTVLLPATPTVVPGTLTPALPTSTPVPGADGSQRRLFLPFVAR